MSACEAVGEIMRLMFAGSLMLLALSGLARAQNGPPPVQGEVDLSGGWLQKMHQDSHERGEGPDIGDYTGLPINDANRLRADTWDSAKWTVPEHQCEPHPADYGLHGPANLQIAKIVDPHSLKTVAYTVMLGWMTPVRTIWLDGRPHPGKYGTLTWQGFSTGKWVGDTLIVETTHLKEGWIRRNGLARSEKAKLTEFWIRHGDVLTVTSFVDDPVYLTEPLVRTWNWVLDAGVHITPYTCVAKVESEREQGYVAHYLPGTNPFLAEFPKKHHIPEVVAHGGAEQTYPEYQETLKRLMPQGEAK
jgi:hypothetical protein